MASECEEGSGNDTEMKLSNRRGTLNAAVKNERGRNEVVVDDGGVYVDV